MRQWRPRRRTIRHHALYEHFAAMARRLAVIGLMYAA
jgi:hypothetical protein